MASSRENSRTRPQSSGYTSCRRRRKLPAPPSSLSLSICSPSPSFHLLSFFLFSKSFHLHSSLHWCFFVFSVRGLATFGIGPPCVSQTVVYTWRLHRQNLYKAMRMHKNQHGRSARDWTHHEFRTPAPVCGYYQITPLIRSSPQYSYHALLFTVHFR